MGTVPILFENFSPTVQAPHPILLDYDMQLINELLILLLIEVVLNILKPLGLYSLPKWSFLFFIIIIIIIIIINNNDNTMEDDVGRLTAESIVDVDI